LQESMNPLGREVAKPPKCQTIASWIGYDEHNGDA
jgi:hypothetical protein